MVLSQPPSRVPRTRSLWSPLRGGRGGGVRNRRRELSCPQRRVSFKSLHFSEERNEQFQPYYQTYFF